MFQCRNRIAHLMIQPLHSYYLRQLCSVSHLRNFMCVLMYSIIRCFVRVFSVSASLSKSFTSDNACSKEFRREHVNSLYCPASMRLQTLVRCSETSLNLTPHVLAILDVSFETSDRDDFCFAAFCMPSAVTRLPSTGAGSSS